MKVKAFTLNSFAITDDGGNPAGVVFDADELTEEQMKEISKVIGFSETAFIMKSDYADYKVRFFTPTEEVDLCGHATIGAFYALANIMNVKPGIYKQETKAGILDVEIKEDLTVLMNQNLPEFYEIIGKAEVAESIGLTAGDMPEDIPAQVVSTGLRDIMVPVRNRMILNAAVPDYRAIEDISRKYSVTGYHVFTLDTINRGTMHCRNFAPLYGIPEESATGTSNGALSCYLYKYGKIDNAAALHIVSEQGYSMNKPSEIICSLRINGRNIIEVKVGGRAKNIKEIEVLI